MHRLTKRILLVAVVTALVMAGHLVQPRSNPVDHTAHRAISRLMLLQTFDNSLPPEWAGIWESDEITYDCDTGLETGRQTNLDTLCAGDPFLADVDTAFTCTGEATATTIDVQCSASIEQFPGCVVNFDVRSFGTRNGDSAEVTTVARFWGTGSCPLPATCDSTVSQMTRIGPEPAECTSPAKPVSWGELKAKYR